MTHRDERHPDDSNPAKQLRKSSQVEGPLDKAAAPKCEAAEDGDGIAADRTTLF